MVDYKSQFSKSLRKKTHNNFVSKDDSLYDILRYVQVAVAFVRIGEIDSMNEKFTAEIYVEAKWIENEEIVEYDPKIYWNVI